MNNRLLHIIAYIQIKSTVNNHRYSNNSVGLSGCFYLTIFTTYQHNKCT